MRKKLLVMLLALVFVFVTTGVAFASTDWGSKTVTWSAHNTSATFYMHTWSYKIDGRYGMWQQGQWDRVEITRDAHIVRR